MKLKSVKPLKGKARSKQIRREDIELITALLM